MEKKKKGKHFIIPASYFKKKGITPIPVKKLDNIEENATEQPLILNEPQPETIKKEAPLNEFAKNLVEERPKIILNSKQKESSGLSLSSIRKKKRTSYQTNGSCS